MISINTGNLLLLTAVQTDQYLNSLLGDALSSTFAQAFVNARAQVLSAGRMGRLTSNGYLGRSAGEADGPLGVWMNATGVRLKDDRAGRDQKGWARSIVAGVDYSLSSATLGAFASWSDLEMNAPTASNESEGWTGGLYGAVDLAPGVSLLGVLGHSNNDVKNERAFGILSSAGKTEREQTFGSVSLEGRFAAGERWTLSPAVTVFASHSKIDAYVDNAGRAVGGFSNNLSLVRVGTTAYYQATGFTPYVSVAWDHYLKDEIGSDGDFARLGAGVALNLSPASYLSIGGMTVVGKKNEREHQFGATIGGRF